MLLRCNVCAEGRAVAWTRQLTFNFTTTELLDPAATGSMRQTIAVLSREPDAITPCLSIEHTLVTSEECPARWACGPRGGRGGRVVGTKPRIGAVRERAGPRGRPRNRFDPPSS